MSWSRAFLLIAFLISPALLYANLFTAVLLWPSVETTIEYPNGLKISGELRLYVEYRPGFASSLYRLVWPNYVVEMRDVHVQGTFQKFPSAILFGEPKSERFVQSVSAREVGEFWLPETVTEDLLAHRWHRLIADERGQRGTLEALSFKIGMVLRSNPKGAVTLGSGIPLALPSPGIKKIEGLYRFEDGSRKHLDVSKTRPWLPKSLWNSCKEALFGRW